MPSHKPLSLEQLRKMRKAVRNINIEHREKLSKLDRLALWVTVRVGTMGFFPDHPGLDGSLVGLEYPGPGGVEL